MNDIQLVGKTKAPLIGILVNGGRQQDIIDLAYNQLKKDFGVSDIFFEGNFQM
jgi:hypothetical protein